MIMARRWWAPARLIFTSLTRQLWTIGGVRKVNIRVVRWGCFSKSLSILMPRQMKAPHVRQMIWRLVMRAET